MIMFTLPDAEEMRRRLRAVDDSSHIDLGFYPVLERSAGESKNALGFALLWLTATSTYTMGLPPEMISAIMVSTPSYVEALIDDEEARTEVLELFLTVGLITH